MEFFFNRTSPCHLPNSTIFVSKIVTTNYDSIRCHETIPSTTFFSMHICHPFLEQFQKPPETGTDLLCGENKPRREAFIGRISFRNAALIYTVHIFPRSGTSGCWNREVCGYNYRNAEQPLPCRITRDVRPCFVCCMVLCGLRYGKESFFGRHRNPELQKSCSAYCMQENCI